MEDKTNIELENKEEVVDGAVTDETTKSLPSTVEPSELINNIKDTDSLNEFLPLFNLSIAKKQAMRVTKREEVLDMVTDRIKERLEKRPDEISITELNAIDKTMSEQKQKEIGLVNAVTETPAISVNQTNNIVMIGDSSIDRDSKDKVVDAVKQILKLVQEEQISTDEVKVVDLTENEQ